MNELRRHGRDLLDEARRERTPDAAARARVFSALMASAALTSTAGASAAPAAAKLLTGFSKWLVLVGLVGTVTGALYLAGHVGVSPPPVPVVAPAVAQPGLPTAIPAPPAAPSARADALPPPTSALPAPATEAAAPPRASGLNREAAAPNLEAELSGLHAAHAAYRVGNAARALALIGEHKARFPKSQLATERATLEVLSLCLAGRSREARSLASRLRKSSSSAAALSGLVGSCAGP